MSTVQNKRILLGITGGIAAYKAAELVRALKERGAEVRVVMTRAACEFITPLTLQALSGNPVHTSLLDTEAEAAMGHIELARWADRVLIAPASADFIARFAGGLGDDLLATLCLATRAPIALAPAMNQAMWDALGTRHNIDLLKDRRVTFYGPASGSQACGEVGPGRMLEAIELAELLAGSFASGALSGRRVVITAGPTREALDPVRYLSNHSSGKMGFALAEAAAEAGAKVVLISGPCALPTPDRVERIDVISADQMLAASLEATGNCHLFIAAAAVCDYRPAHRSAQKLKKHGDESLKLELVQNPDIVATVAAQKKPTYCVAFAAETERVLDYARAKRARKGVECIIANDVSGTDTGFNSDDNAVTLIDEEGEILLDKRSKTQLARDLIALLATKSDSTEKSKNSKDNGQ
ncbi:bifunctional phosphopantothenoylcysteine decarboxylase/phosphopantothenate--cysteine ligase CoaBC [Gilvimarinus algae]|uniref:Coenzyme A biosynthesis bifunctional protein CoaBC n=1 Tax=Gilvimarinus algae TaxID=3058037 RepID=A0ABT8TCH3_9GAMM|nr:bifunctional phosphopantothenoylcysteine decarboxylase/phosphopantothenate--cysteine ligase CoaBC [Gilvimarinus sp. SDUM040014]MDO3381340.1 bifunctional phosphopantothenoylcysteine decarboxylase/phosphopantothenate--cysteine ligase CoaBC [Gilvimarinus sp. SDUM040014]